MAIQNVNGSQEVPEYKSPEDVNLKPAEVYESQKIGNVLAGIENSVDRDINQALANDGLIDDAERSLLERWLSKAKSVTKSITGIVSKTYEGYCERFTAVINKLEEHINTAQASNEYEPDETDADVQNHKAQSKEVTAEMLRIPERKFSYFAKHIKDEYYRCVDNKNSSNRKIASDLKCFQAKYEKELKEVASSIDSDSKYRIDTLYDQIESQIRYYETHAEEDAKKNQEEYLNAKYGFKQPDSARAKAYGDALMGQTHSHDGVDDLAVLGYDAEEAEAVLKSDQETQNPPPDTKLERRYD